VIRALLLVSSCVVSSIFAAPDDRAAKPAITAVSGVAITVGDLDRSVAFYRDVLEFELVSIEERAGDSVERLEGVFGARLRVATLTLGTERIELRDFLGPEGRAMPEDSRGNDRWFQHVAIVVADMARAYEKLASRGVEHASQGPQRLPDWNPSAGGIEAFYFKDPDRHWLELIRFPQGKGDPRWQAASDRLFLGIDHTAIVVADTEAALEFYRDRLGLVVAGGSENFGIEQERLNGVFGARLRITTLRAASGIGLELLDYLAPGDGRPIPSDVRAADHAHWWTLFEVRDVDGVLDGTRAHHPRWVSPGSIELESGRRAATLRDPDHHGLWIAAPSLP
jgi:catechol 2,3-dioxygenase-like lactoylglutathione lyase family enzyme